MAGVTRFAIDHHNHGGVEAPIEHGPESLLDQLSARRQALDALAERIADLAVGLGEPAVAARAREEMVKLRREEFNLAILGEFNRGKSTLLNALIGAELLPTSIIPLTSIVTYVAHGGEPGATVELADGRSHEIELDQLAAHTTERGNPDNEKRVRRVTIRFPSPVLRAGLRLIDTPGIGSVHDASTATTLELLPRLDAALFLMSATHPASKQELEFLRQVRPHLDKLFFVLNKVDLVGAAEREESLAFCSRVIRRALETEDLRIYPISARAALEARLRGDTTAREVSGLAVLEADLSRFLDRQRSAVLIAGAHRRLGAGLDELAGIVELRRQAARMSLDTLDERIAEFERQSDRAV